MKAIQEFVAVVERWWVIEQPLVKPFIRRSTASSSPSSLDPQASRPGAVVPPPQPHPTRTKGRLSPCRPRRRRKNIRHPRLAFALTVLSLTAILGQRFYNQPGLQVGSVAPSTVFAPDDAQVEDKETTEERRRDARNGCCKSTVAPTKPFCDRSTT